MIKKAFCLFSAGMLVASLAFAEVSIETSVSRSQLPVGDQLVLDIIISNADGRIEQPKISSIEGFTSYSQGHSQEFTLINGQSSSRSIYSYVLVANSSGEKMIGPFAVVIAGKEYKVAPVKVEVMQGGAAQSPSSSYTWSQTPVSAPSPRSMPGPGSNVGDQDIFVKAWLDKDEVFVNEPVMLTYTLFTRLSATYKGFDKEPVTTGFWVEDFPPEKTVRRTEQFLNGQRYVVADVRKLALFPTQAGIFTVEPGQLSSTVEVRNDTGFQTFFSGNVFGSRRAGFPQPFMSEIISKSLPTDTVKLTVKPLPSADKPADFSGAVGQYQIESSLDKNDVEAGDPVTLRVRVFGTGNINTVQPPKLPKMDDFKVYESATSSHVSKERLIVEGEKITETVIVPRKAGTYEIPSISFPSFDPRTGSYRTVKSEAHTLKVSGTTAVSDEPESKAGMSAAESIFEPASQANVDFVAKDIRFIKNVDDNRYVPEKEIYRHPLYWLLNALFLVAGIFGAIASGRRANELSDMKGSRLRRSHAAARAKLRTSAKLMKQANSDAFYAEVSQAVTGYFADKFNIPVHGLALSHIEELAQERVTAEQLNKIKKLFNEMSMGRFSRAEKSAEHMEEIYDLADEVMTFFEKVKVK